MRTAVVLPLIGAAALLAGCGSSTDDDKAQPITTRQAATSAPTSTAAATIEPAAACYPAAPANDPDLQVFTDGLQLPAGVQVVTGRVSTQSDKPGLVGVAIDLCVPTSTTPDALRPIATDIAKALKGTELGGRTFALYVADLDGKFNTEAKIKDPDFKLHLWNGKPSAKAELSTWQVVKG